jgi:hypothetical protein
LLQTHIGFAIIDLPEGSRAATPLNGIGTIIVSDQVDNDLAEVLAFAHKKLLAIREGIKESKADGLHNRRLPRSICPTNGSRPRPKINREVAIAFDVF